MNSIWLLSQDKETLIQALYIDRCECEIFADNYHRIDTIGIYATEERAKEVMEAICLHINGKRLVETWFREKPLKEWKIEELEAYAQHKFQVISLDYYSCTQALQEFNAKQFFHEEPLDSPMQVFQLPKE